MQYNKWYIYMSSNSYNNSRSYSHFRYTQKLNLERLKILMEFTHPGHSTVWPLIALTLELEHLLLHPVFTSCISSAFAAWQILSDCVLIDWGIGFLFLCFGFLNQRWRKYLQSSVFIGWGFGATFWLEEKAQEFVSKTCFHGKWTVFSVYVYWSGLQVRKLLKTTARVRPHPTLGIAMFWGKVIIKTTWKCAHFAPI